MSNPMTPSQRVEAARITAEVYCGSGFEGLDEEGPTTSQECVPIELARALARELETAQAKLATFGVATP